MVKKSKLLLIPLKNCIFIIIFIFLTGILLKLINLYTPLLTRKIIDNISKYKNIQALKSSLLYIIYILVGFLSISFLHSILNINYNIKIENNIRKFYLNEIFKKKITFFKHFSKGEIIYRLEKDFIGISDFVNQIILSIPLNLIMFSSLFFMIKWNKTLTIFVIILVFIQSLIVVIFKKPLAILSEIFKQSAEKLDNFYINFLDRIILLKANNAYLFEKNKHNKSLNNLFKTYKKRGIVSEFSSILVHFIFNLWTFAIIWYGGKQVINNKMTVGQIFGFMMYANMLSSPINYFINFFFSIPIFKVSLKRVLEIVNFDNEIYSNEFKNRIIFETNYYTTKQKKVSIKLLLTKQNKDLNTFNNFKTDKFINKICIKNEIRKNNINKNSYFIIKNLNFSYNSDKPILKNINFKIPSKGLLIISGESGSGKTTLCKILTGFYKDYDGEIYFKDKELKKWEVDKLRKKIIYMPQEQFLINGNLLENIFYGYKLDYENVLITDRINNRFNINKNNLISFKSILSSKEILTIIINDLKKKYPEIINCNLTKFLNFLMETNYFKPEFSTGQAQRIAFIRALLQKPEILILDEPTSALDKENEKILLDIINKLKDYISIIIVSHKNIWLNLTDNILRIED